MANARENQGDWENRGKMRRGEGRYGTIIQVATATSRWSCWGGVWWGDAQRTPYIYRYLEYNSICPLVRIGTTHPSPATECVPPEPRGGQTRLLVRGGGGGSQFELLEKKPSTLSTLWGYVSRVEGVESARGCANTQQAGLQIPSPLIVPEKGGNLHVCTLCGWVGGWGWGMLGRCGNIGAWAPGIDMGIAS
jgi:hypothetical protein